MINNWVASAAHFYLALGCLHLKGLQCVSTDEFLANKRINKSINSPYLCRPKTLRKEP